MNILLLAFDLLVLPITIVRLILIYFFGSRYNIKNFEFLDVMLHASHKYFNQQENVIGVDNISDDIRTKINYCSRYIRENIVNKIKEPSKDQVTDTKSIELVQLPISDADTLEKTEPIQISQPPPYFEMKEPNHELNLNNEEDKNKLLNLIDNLKDDANTNPKTQKLILDIDKLNLKLKEVDKILEENLK